MKTDACNNNKFAIEILNSGRCGSIEQPVIMQAEEEYGIKDLIPGETLNLECHANGFPEPNSESSVTLLFTCHVTIHKFLSSLNQI